MLVVLQRSEGGIHWQQLGTEVVEREDANHVLERREESLSGTPTPYIGPANAPVDLNHGTVSLCQKLQVVHQI